MVTQDLIWNSITNSAKTKFNYSSFESRFNENEKNIPENLLFEFIVGLAENKPNLLLALELSFELTIFNIDIEINKILNFIAEKKDAFQLEIGLTKMVDEELQKGNEPEEILPIIQYQLGI